MMPFIKSLFSGKKWMIVAGVAVVIVLGVFMGPRAISDWYVEQGVSKGTGTDAIGDFDKALQFNPQNAGAYFSRGSRHSTLKEWDQAIQDFDKALSLDPNLLFAYFERGYAYDKLGNLGAAYQDYTHVIQQKPDFDLAYLSRAGISERLGHNQDAIQDYSKFLSLYPKDDVTSREIRNHVRELSSTPTP